VIGNAEGQAVERQGRLSAIAVASAYLHLSLARKTTSLLGLVLDENCRGFFADLYARCINFMAMLTYEGRGLSVYRRAREFYGNLGSENGGRDEEDIFDVRKALSQDSARRSVQSNGRDVVSAPDVS
ncbi:hypothetical protein GGU10DRAFT_239999, partial [Lentinula aff. detonsa]